MILQSILTWVLVGMLMYIGVKIYETVTEQMGVTNGIDVAREVIGGYILAYVLWYERGMAYNSHE